MEKILSLTATELGQRIGSGKLCPVDLTEAYLNFIKLNPKSESIFTKVMIEQVLEQAKKARSRVRNNCRHSQLDGIPISWKDVCDTKGIPTEAGSALLKNRIPGKTAMVIENVTKAGVTSIGKTHMSELAFSGLGVNPITKTPPNAIDPKLAPGGSSSGAAVSVALNLNSGSIGSDTGGSVRVPAAWNNLVGLKTTHGLVSLEGVVPLCPKFDTLGPIVKSVEDATNILSAMVPDCDIKIQSSDIKIKDVAVIETGFLDNLDNEIGYAFEKSLELLANYGIKITRIKSSIINEALALSALVFSPEAYGIWKNIIEKDPSKMYPPILERFRSGQQTNAPDYVEAWQSLGSLRKKYLKLTDDFDVILAPTTPILPPKINNLLTDSKYFAEQNLLALRNTRVANLLGLPALTLPTMFTFCGFMLMTKPFQEKFLLNIGKTIEGIIKN
mgnify:CR=1 FL=1